jgi:hypothetical protein
MLIFALSSDAIKIGAHENAGSLQVIVAPHAPNAKQPSKK